MITLITDSNRNLMDCDEDEISKMATAMLQQDCSLNAMTPMDDVLSQFQSPSWNDLTTRFRGCSNDSMAGMNAMDFATRFRGFSNDSVTGTRPTTRSFNFDGVTPLAIPEAATHQPLNEVNGHLELPQSAYDPSSLSTVSSFETAGIDKREFVRTAPAYRHKFSSWDQAIAQLKTPEVPEHRETMDQDVDLQNGPTAEMVPHFMKSNFFMDEPMTNTMNNTLGSQSYSGYPTVPQSAPCSFSTSMFAMDDNAVNAPHLIFGDGSPLVNDSCSDALDHGMDHQMDQSMTSMTLTEADIFGVGSRARCGSNGMISNIKGRDRNWSNLTTESENEPILNLVGRIPQRKRQRSLSYNNLPPRQQTLQKVNTNSHTNSNGDLPPMLYGSTTQLYGSTTRIKTEDLYPKRKRPVAKRRGRPPKSAGAVQGKYSGLKKAEREKMRRKELKEGYATLTEMLGMNVVKSGAALPDRSQIVEAACQEIKRLENMRHRQLQSK